MPIYALVLISVFGFIAYVSVGVFLGTRACVIINRLCQVSWHDHTTPSVFIGIFWPVGMSIFTAWYMAKHSKFNHVFKEG